MPRTSQLDEKVDPHPLLNVLLRRGAPPAEYTRSIKPENLDFDENEGLEIPQLIDALAFFCVSKATGQRAAISMTTCGGSLKTDGMITLRLALSSGAPEPTVNFLEELWKLVRKLSLVNKKHHDGPSSSPSPEGRKEINHVITEMVLLCYGHCVSKLVKRLSKRWNEFLAFQKLLRTKSHIPEGQHKQFDRVAFALEEAHFLLGEDPSKKFDRHRLKQIAMILHEALEDYELLVEESKSFHMWASTVKEKNKPAFPILKFLGKCYGLDASIHHVIEFALSRESTWIIKRKFIVHPLRLESRRLSFSTTDWEKYLVKVFETAKIKPNPRSRILHDEVERASLASIAESRRPIPIHCEALLLAHYHRTRNDTAESLSLTYFGYSKAPCQTCALYFESYRDSSAYPGLLFRSDRAPSRQAPDTPWAAPELDDARYEDSVNRKMFEHLCGVYASRLELSREASSQYMWSVSRRRDNRRGD